MYPGTDLLQVSRLSKAFMRQPKLKYRLFTQKEISECERRGSPELSFAGRFAAKEAVLKALGTGLRGLKWLDVEILNNELGKPEVYLHDSALQIAQRQNIKEVRVSISHTGELAVAFAIAITGEEIR